MATSPILPIGDFRPFTREDCEQTVTARFEQQVARYPERAAVRARGREVSYRALSGLAHRVAAALRAEGARPQRPIGLLLEHDVTAIAGVLGVLEAGGIVVGLDPSSPESRTAAILDDAQVDGILTSGPHLVAARRLAGPDGRVIDVGMLPDAPTLDGAPVSIGPDALAYLLYTSGTTGPPKGVMQTHRNVLRSAQGYTNGFRITAEDNVALFASLGVAQGVVAASCAVLNGAAVCPRSLRDAGIDGLADWLAREAITVFISAGTIFREFAQSLTGAEEFPRLRLIKVGSEPIRDTDVALYKRFFGPRCVFVNALGTTEALGVTQYVIDKHTEIAGKTAPVGHPEEGLAILLLDEAGAEVGAGAVGEIAIKSRYLSPGYWQRPEQTRSVFVPTEDGERLYRTGDLGRALPDGCVEHLGRKDFRVKVHGVRIELEEVEAALARHAAVRAAAAAVRDEDDDIRLIAYVVPAPSPPTISELRRHLAAILPEASVPSAFILLDALPLMPNGKVDRRALRECTGQRPPVDAAFVAPRTPFEQALADIWGDVLRLDRVGVHDSFFDLGGTSLSAMRVLTRVREWFQADVSIQTLFEQPTLEGFARALVSSA